VKKKPSRKAGNGKGPRKGAGPGVKKKKKEKPRKPAITALACRGAVGERKLGEIRAAMGNGIDLSMVTLVCSGQIRTGFLLSALEAGADGVCVFACPEDGCRYQSGSGASREIVQKTKGLLGTLGLSGERVERFEFSPKETRTPSGDLGAYAERIRELGKLP
jgi:coenzyme F420-reducing hydrogenase delta subunit